MSLIFLLNFTDNSYWFSCHWDLIGAWRSLIRATTVKTSPRKRRKFKISDSNPLQPDPNLKPKQINNHIACIEPNNHQKTGRRVRLGLRWKVNQSTTTYPIAHNNHAIYPNYFNRFYRKLFSLAKLDSHLSFPRAYVHVSHYQWEKRQMLLLFFDSSLTTKLPDLLWRVSDRFVSVLGRFGLTDKCLVEWSTVGEF